jgi:hexosaminidase
VFGALRGLETFSQMVGYLGASFLVNAAMVNDAPRFQHRGALVDSSRHFLALPALQAFVDALAYTKMNVLHWHIVDSQSFPYVSAAFPNLSAAGAYPPVERHTYSQADVVTLVSYAKDRGVRVVVEFDTPGHSDSWGLGQPSLLTPCYNSSGAPDGTFGPINPTLDSTWAFLTAFFTEVAAVFPDPYLHVGGDEVGFDCWRSNPSVVAWMAAHGMAGNFSALESYYVQRLLKLVQALGKTPVGWQEIFDNGLELTPDTLVHVWKNPFAAGQLELARVTAGGQKALLSAGWYLNYISYGPVWEAAYSQDPLNFTGTPAQKVRGNIPPSPPLRAPLQLTHCFPPPTPPPLRLLGRPLCKAGSLRCGVSSLTPPIC